MSDFGSAVLTVATVVLGLFVDFVNAIRFSTLCFYRCYILICLLLPAANLEFYSDIIFHQNCLLNVDFCLKL